MSNRDDPRDASLEVPMTLPASWKQTSEAIASSAMFLASAVMLTRNRYLAWPCLLLALNGHFTRQPLRTKDGGNTLSAVLFAIAAVVASYIASMLIPAEPPMPLQAPIPMTP